MNDKKIRFRIKRKYEYIPIDFFDRVIASGDCKHTIKLLTHDNSDYWDIILNEYGVIDGLEKFNRCLLHHGIGFFETFGKDAFDITFFEYIPDEFRWDLKGNLELNELKYNLGSIEYIRRKENGKEDNKY